MPAFNRRLMSECINDKWEPLLRGEIDVLYISNCNNCVACKFFLSQNCQKCPISKYANDTGCRNTPLIFITSFINNNYRNLDLQAELTAAIQMEIDFLNMVGNTIK